MMLFCVALGLRADIVYEATTGWKSTDSSLEARLNQGLENPEALRLMNEAAVIYAQGDKEKARTTYREVVKRFPASLLAPQAFYEIGQIRLEQGSPGKAFEAFGHIIQGYPNYQNFDALIKEMFSLAEQLQEEKTGNVFGLWKYKDHDVAIQAFEKIVTAAPYSDYAPRALFLIARLYKEKKEPLSSIDAYERLIGSYPNHPLAADTYLALADTYRGMIAGAPYDQGATQQAIRTYEDFIAQFPQDPRVPEAQGNLARMKEILAEGKYNLAVFYLDKRKNPTAAGNLLREVIQTAPESQTAQKAQKMLEKMSGQETDNTPTAIEPQKTEKSFLDKLLFWKKS